MLAFFFPFLSLSDVVFLTRVLLESILTLLPLALRAVLTLREELMVVDSFSFLWEEVLISYLIDLGEYRVRLLRGGLSKK